MSIRVLVLLLAAVSFYLGTPADALGQKYPYRPPPRIYTPPRYNPPPKIFTPSRTRQQNYPAMRQPANRNFQAPPLNSGAKGHLSTQFNNNRHVNNTSKRAATLPARKVFGQTSANQNLSTHSSSTLPARRTSAAQAIQGNSGLHAKPASPKPEFTRAAIGLPKANTTATSSSASKKGGKGNPAGQFTPHSKNTSPPKPNAP